MFQALTHSFALSPMLAESAPSLLDPHPGALLPFVFMLLGIAVMPFVHKHWWETHYPKVAVGLGLVVLVYYTFGLRSPGRMLSVAHEYLSFMALIGSLFIVAGGVHIRVRGEATPFRNVLFLLVGSVLANLVGTTGASMLLIRPWIRMNKYRITGFHVVFFIFLVSNVAGALTPIGDPPLFLGYLKGIPFFWTLTTLWKPWIFSVTCLLVMFFVLDFRNFLRAPKPVREIETAHESFQIKGLHNALFLGLILGAVLMQQKWHHLPGLSEGIMVAAAFLSYRTTSREVHAANDFNLAPLREVAWLFLGIFATMVPALDYLSVHASELGVDSPLKMYFFAGVLSSVLDNAPTYLTFLAAAMGREHLNIQVPADVATFLGTHSWEVAAISLGAVFFGAMTYIGNGPNFMVKSIADQSKVETPGFFGYILRYSLPILLPVLVLVAVLWFLK